MRNRTVVLIFIAAALLLSGGQARIGSPPVAKAALPGENGKIAYEIDGGISVSTPGTAGGTPLVSPGRQPAWSPNGRRLAYVEADKLVVIRDDATDRMDISPPAGVSDPSWSPDGNHIVFASQNDLFRVEVSESALSNVTNITNTPTIVEQEPDWGALGTRIAYVEDNPSFPERRLAIRTLATSAVAYVSGAEGLLYPSWSPDESTFAFTARSDLASVQEAKPQGDFADIYVISASGGTPTNLTSSIGVQEYAPAWSPDGTKIAYVHDDGVDEHIKTMSATGTGKTEVTIGLNPAWQPVRQVIAGVEFTQGIQEMQSVSALQVDLQGDSKPPVPIVGERAAVMRVYLDEVDATTQYLVEVTGEITQSDQVTVNPGCTATDRRRNDSGCESLDYYFTPPQGNWSVALKVSDTSDGTVVLDETFDLTSVDTSGLIVKYVPICVKLTAGAAPTCPSSFVDTNAPGLMKKLFPVQDDELFYEQLAIPPVILDAPLPRADATFLRAALRNYYNLMAQGGFVADQLAGWLPSGGAVGLAGISDPVWGGSTGRVSWQVDTSASDPPDGLDAQHTLAHEIAHNLGMRHTNLPDGCGAQDSNTDWPYADSTIQEVGFDVAAQQVMLPTKKDLATYCTPPGSGIWVSPFSYNKLLEGDFNPQGGAQPAGAATSQFLVVNGTAQADGSSATINSAYVINSATPADQPDPLGNYCLHLTGGIESDYCFPLEFEDHRNHEALPAETFALRVPLPGGTTRVALMHGADELAALEASGAAPDIEITVPEELSGEETLTWSASDGDGDPLQYAVMYSPDAGATWLPLAADITDSELTLDTSVLDGDEVLIRVLASDGLNTTIDTTTPITLVTGTDRTWGDVKCDGNVNLGDSIALARHLVSLDPGQSAGCPAMGAAVTVGPAERTWGDLDCSGTLGLGDAIAVARFLVGLLPSTPGCPVLGTTVTVQA